jgi:hypothetical protein
MSGALSSYSHTPSWRGQEKLYRDCPHRIFMTGLTSEIPLSVSFHQCAIPVFVCYLIFLTSSEGQAGTVLKPSNKTMFSHASWGREKKGSVLALVFSKVYKYIA